MVDASLWLVMLHDYGLQLNLRYKQVRTRLEQKSDMRLQEVYEEAEVAGVTIPIPARVQVRACVCARVREFG